MSKSDRMRAGVFLGEGAIELRDVPVPAPGPGQALLKVAACGVCGTDYHIFAGEYTEGIYPPVVLGHEVAAHVETVGAGVETLAPGQFCALDPLVGCGSCAWCRRGEPNHCPAPSIIGYKHDGGFAQYCLAPAEKVVAMDESVGRSGGVLCETLACVLRGYDRLQFGAGASAMILGAGTVGLLWAQMLRSSPCGKLIQTEIAEFRRQKASRLGADLVIDPRAEDLADRVRAELPDGVDFIVDATGEPGAVAQAFALLAKGGTLMPFGCCPAGSKWTIDPSEIFSKELRIIGSKMPPGCLDRAARLIESGRIACDEIVTVTLGLDRLRQSVAEFNDHRESQVKVAIDPWA